MILPVTVCLQLFIHIVGFHQTFHLPVLQFFQHRPDAPVHIDAGRTDKGVPGQIMGDGAL